MDKEEVLYEALKNYFNALENMGYMKYSQVYKILMFSFLLDLLEDSVNILEEDDYKLIEQLLHCLLNTSCIIPNRVKLFTRLNGEFTTPSLNTRITEDEIIRITEEDAVRLTEL